MTYSGSGNPTAPLARPANLGCDACDWAGLPAGGSRSSRHAGGPVRARSAIKTTNAAAAGASADRHLQQHPGAAERHSRRAPRVSRRSRRSARPTRSAESLAAQIAAGRSSSSVNARTSSRLLQTKNVLAELPGRDDDERRSSSARISTPSTPGPGSTTTAPARRRSSRRRSRWRRSSRATPSASPGGARRSRASSARRATSQPYAGRARPDRAEPELRHGRSPNFVRFVYDGDNSAFPVGPAPRGPPGSARSRRCSTSYFASQGLPSAETPFSGRSDYGPFIARASRPAGSSPARRGSRRPRRPRSTAARPGSSTTRATTPRCDTFPNFNGTRSTERGRDRARHDHVRAEHRGGQRRPRQGQLQAQARGAGEPELGVRGGGGLRATTPGRELAVPGGGLVERGPRSLASRGLELSRR